MMVTWRLRCVTSAASCERSEHRQRVTVMSNPKIPQMLIDLLEEADSKAAMGDNCIIDEVHKASCAPVHRYVGTGAASGCDLLRQR